MTKTTVDIEKIESEYKQLAPVAEDFRKELGHNLESLIRDNGITLGFPIQGRVKKWSSISEKIERINLKIKSINELQDLVGLRLLLLYRRDVEKISELINERFEIIKQYNTLDRLKEDQFGYSSIHFIIELPKDWLKVPTLSRFGSMRAEIQIRSFAQHIWAEVSHSLQYKNENNVPHPLLRSIYRASALLETVDLEFERLLIERDEYIGDISKESTSLSLDVNNIENILTSILPENNKEENEDYSDLQTDLEYFKIKTTDKLRALIETNLAEIIKDDNEHVQEDLRMLDGDKESYDGSPDELERVMQGVFFTHIGLVRSALEFEFGEKYQKYRGNKYKST